MSVLGAAAIGAASSLLGGVMNKRATKSASDANTALQREFAQNGIRWRVEDAKAAGLSPLAALGASGASFSPSVQVGSMGDAVSNMGQDISRAVYANASAAERKEESARLQAYNEAQLKLQTENMGLQNDLIRQQINTNKLQALKSLDSIGLPSGVFRGPVGRKVRGSGEIPGQNSSIVPVGPGAEVQINQVPAYLSNDPSVRAGKVPAWIETTDGMRLLDSNLIEDQPWPIIWGLYLKEAKRQMEKWNSGVSNKSVFPRSGKW